MTESSLYPGALERLHAVMAGHVGRGELPGLVWLVAAGDEVHVDAIGRPALDDPGPLARDALFRIASLTKPIGAAAAMLLVEDGVVGLDDPVDDLLPELASPRVLRSIDAELDDTVPAARSVVKMADPEPGLSWWRCPPCAR